MQAFIDYYKLLSVNTGASPAEIKKRYHQLAMTSHPDHGGSDAAMQRLNDAYSVLSQPALKTKYDEVYLKYHAPSTHQPSRSAHTFYNQPSPAPHYAGVDYSEVNVKYTFIMQLKDYLHYQLIFDIAWLALKVLYALLDLIVSVLGF